MTKSSANNRSGCRGFERAAQLSRREALRVGGLFGMGLSLPQLLQARAEAKDNQPTTFGRAKQVIVLFLHGGHPQQETFDPKPDGPSAVRGEFGAIATSLPGVQFSELLPQTARLAHRLAVVRSMSHANANHVTASLPAKRDMPIRRARPKPTFPPAATDFPPFGAVLEPRAARRRRTCRPGFASVR